MRVAKTDVICGLAAPEARRLMRAYNREYLPVDAAAAVLGVENSPAVKVLSGFVEAGYLDQRQTLIQSAGNNWSQVEWVTTIRGNALGMASFGNPITRGKAEQLVAGIVVRTKAYNRDPARLLSIVKVTVFGSFLDPGVDRLGDVDVALVHARRFETPSNDVFFAQRRDYVVASGAPASIRGDFMSMLTWPEIEVVRVIKNRSTAINVTEEDVTKFTDRFEVIYAIAADEGAILPTSMGAGQRAP